MDATNETAASEADEKKEDLVYPHTAPLDEQRRAFVLETMADAELDGRLLVQNMDLVYKWLADGSVPPTEKSKRVPTLKTV
jgi:hypothetical protein